MNALLFNRQLGLVPFRNHRRTECYRLLQAIQPANIAFNGRVGFSENHQVVQIHSDGVNSIAVDRFEGK
jgi:hypothetical protein